MSVSLSVCLSIVLFGLSVFNCLSAILYASLSMCFPYCLTVCLSVSMYVSLYDSLTVCLSDHLYVCLSLCLPVCQSVCSSVCHAVCQSVCLSASLSVCLCLFVCLCLSVCLPACPSACPFVFFSTPSLPQPTKNTALTFPIIFPSLFPLPLLCFAKLFLVWTFFCLFLLQKSFLLLSLLLAVVVCPFDSHIQLSDKKVQHLQANITDQRMSNSSHNIWHCLPYNTVITLNLLKPS